MKLYFLGRLSELQGENGDMRKSVKMYLKLHETRHLPKNRQSPNSKNIHAKQKSRATNANSYRRPINYKYIKQEAIITVN